jgi:antitoxin (DNA-binding transcriptional repressor) of toxin-antitoxin stability system
LEAVLKGEEIIITKKNEPVVKLGPVKLAKKPPLQPGSAAGKVGIADDFDAPRTTENRGHHWEHLTFVISRNA